MKQIEFEGTTHQFPDDFTDADISAALASSPAAAPPAPQGTGVMDALGTALGNRINEAAAFPGKVAQKVAGVATTNPLDLIPKPEPSVALPLALPGGGSVATRLGAFAAGKMMEKPSPSSTENLKTAATGIVGNPMKPLSMVTSPAIIEAGAPLLSWILNRVGPGAKKAISLATTERVGGDIANVTGAPPMRTPRDILDETTGAFKRQTESTAAYDAALATHRQAVADARAEAARLSREGRAAQAAEWKGKQQEYQQTVDRLEAEARAATAGLQNTTDAMTRVVNERNRGQAATGLHDVINRVSPQLAAALNAPGAQGLRNAGAGGARRTLGAGKEEVTQALEAAAPEGIRVPSLAPRTAIGPSEGAPGGMTVSGDDRISVRDALDDLSRLGAGRPPQFAKNPLDRNILGAEARARYGQLAAEIRRGFDEVAEGLGNVFQRGQQVYREGLAVSKALLEPNKNWTPTGDVNVGALATDIVKPRMRRALEDKLGAERYGQIAEGVTGLPREVPRQRSPRIEASLPEPPVKPSAFPAVEPTLQAEPTQAPRSAADTVMMALFGPQNRVLQGRDTLVNWSAVAKALQSPQVRAELEATPGVGVAGYDRILRSILGGARQGAEVPAAGTGRLFGPVVDLLSGREKGGGFATTALVRSLAPNLGAHYPGNTAPYTLPPSLQAILDVAMQRAGGAALSGERRK